MGLVSDLLEHKDATYSSAIRSYKAKLEKQRQADFIWKGRFAAGNFERIDCCVKKVLEQTKKGRRFAVKTTYKLDMGHLYHDLYQQAAQNTPLLKFVRPYNIPEHLLTVKDGDEKSRFFECWPEIAVTLVDPEAEPGSKGHIVVSGIADDVENYHNRPMVVEIKSSNEDLWKFQNEFEKHVLQDKHITQAKFYWYMMNKAGYYNPLKLRDEVKLLYISTKGETGDPASEREMYFEVTDEDITKFEALEKEAIKQVRAETSGIEVPCQNPFCKEHREEHGLFNGACFTVKE